MQTQRESVSVQGVLFFAVFFCACRVDVSQESVVLYSSSNSSSSSSSSCIGRSTFIMRTGTREIGRSTLVIGRSTLVIGRSTLVIGRGTLVIGRGDL